MDKESKKHMIQAIIQIAEHVANLDRAFGQLQAHLQSKQAITRSFGPSPLDVMDIKKRLESGIAEN